MKTNMAENYELLPKRVLDTLERTDLEQIKEKLKRIKGNTICTGVGGSKVVSDYASAVLEKKNNVIAISCEPQVLPHNNLQNYENVLACSYSGKNYGVEVSFSNHLKKYLLSRNTQEGVHNLTYLSGIPDEHSFISIAATLMPMSILLAYYLENETELIKEIVTETAAYKVRANDVYEIISGSNPNAAETFLESTFTESGIAIPVVHGKYGYCHGRSTLSKEGNHSVIIINQNTDLDQLMLEEFPKYYQEIICIESKYQDPIIDIFYQTYQAMLIAREIAIAKEKDLSNVEYSPLVKKLYNFKGSM